MTGSRRFQLRRGRGVLAFAAAAALAALGCGEGTAPKLPPIVLISLDTVRADHLSLHGYGVRTSPALEAFAKQADVYEKAWATAPWTVPSHASMFTGLYPFAHGAHTFEASGEDALNVRPLAAAHVTLAEFLRGLGYRTGAFVANNGFLTPRFQFDQGFDTYVVNRIPGIELNRVAVAWLAEAPDEPFFLFVNYLDAHRPYNTQPVPGLPPAPTESSVDLLDRLYAQAMGGEGPVDPMLVRRIVAQYDAGVANADRAFGELIRTLAAAGLSDDALVIVTSDHGEFFGEHALVEHSKDVYEPAMRVPLLVRRPGQRRGQRISEPISIADVPGLVVAALPGVDVLPPRPFQVPVQSRPIVAENYLARTKDLRHPVWGHRFQRIRAVLYEWPYKYIRSSDGDDELFDLETDPGELRDLRVAEPERAAAMRDVLAASVPADGSPRVEGSLDLSSDEREAMRALGYLDDAGDDAARPLGEP